MTETDNPNDPFDPYCMRFARDMTEYDIHLVEEDLPTTPENRAQACIDNEGTYNKENGHFACTECYIKIGMPSAPWPGWKAP